MYQKYLDPQRQYADFTVGEETDVASLILSARIKELLSTSHEASEHEAM
jgi:uridine kinase